VEKELAELDTRLADAGTDRSGLKTKYDALTGEVAAARNAADAARTRLDTDTANLEKAEKTAVDALERASKAKQALDRATDAKTRAERVITPMRNNLTNLKSRKDKTDQAQKSCGESFEACREANTKLQGLSNEPLSDVASAYELVRKHYKDTTFHERQTRDMKGYIDQGTELYEKVEDLTPQAAAVGGDETGNI
jgi:chromosome segregation ATPase